MANYYVFSDVDETLIKFKSMLTFMQYFLFESEYAQRNACHDKQNEFSQISLLAKNPKNNREILNRRFYQLFNGISTLELRQNANAWIEEKIRNDDLFVDGMFEEYQIHKRNGAQIVLVSGSFEDILSPIKEYVKADKLICSELEVVNEVYTGVLLKQVIGPGKWLGISDYLEGKSVDLSACYAYGDHESDLCFMEKVGYPILVGGAEDFRKFAQSKNWRIMS
jgi:HAD superfamily hydrolase (TIGR01490 family)